MVSLRIAMCGLAATLFFAVPASAQELSIRSDLGVDLIEAVNTSPLPADRIAIRGESVPAPYWGIGGYFSGGYRAVVGLSNVAGTGSRYGGYFYASGGTTSNFGVYAFASGTSAYAGYFLGNVYVSGTLTQASDARLKSGIRDLEPGSLASLLRLKPKVYFYRTDDFPGLSLPKGSQTGFLAQDVAEVFPDLVKKVKAPSDNKDDGEEILSVDYIKLIPILVKAVQEQQAQIEALKQQLARR